MNDFDGPVIYAQSRIGKGGTSFKIFKFRSMSVNAENILKSNADLYSKYLSDNFKLLPEDDPRITKIGLFLRKTSGLKSIFETDFKKHSEPRLPSTAQINH